MLERSLKRAMVVAGGQGGVRCDMREAGARGRPRHGRVLRESARGRVLTGECSQGQGRVLARTWRARGFNDFVLCENPESDVCAALKPDSDVTNQLQATLFQSGFSNPVESVIDLTLHTPNPKVNVTAPALSPKWANADRSQRPSLTTTTPHLSPLVCVVHTMRYMSGAMQFSRG